MMGPQLSRMSDGSLRLSELAPWFVGVLVQLPDLLDSDQPEAVSQRLYPDPSDDKEIQETWDKYVRPELFALVATAREIVLQDIGNLRLGTDPDPRGEDTELLPPGLAMCSLDIPGKHVQAWISALNVARLTLSTRFELEDMDMTEPDDDDELDEEEDDENVFDMRRIAIAQVHLLGFLQQMLVEEENPPPSDVETPWSPEEE